MFFHSSDVTHVIAECIQDQAVCQRTLKYMMAVASGKWILSHRCKFNSSSCCSSCLVVEVIIVILVVAVAVVHVAP